MSTTVPATVSHVQFVSFTKDEAKELYEKRGQNRTESLKVVKDYAAAMNGGNWRTFDRSQSPVMFDASGTLRAGQHRIHAFIVSELTEMTFPVITDATEEEVRNQDGGHNRSLAHRVEMSFKVPEVGALKSKMISATRILAALTTDGSHDPAQIAEVANGYSTAILAIRDVATSNGPATKFAPVIAAFIWAHSKMDSALWEQALRYFDTGDNCPNALLLRFREQLITGKIQTRRVNEVFFKCVSALKATHKGKTEGVVTSSKANLEGWTDKPKSESAPDTQPDPTAA